jgi:hypothetical protein
MKTWDKVTDAMNNECQDGKLVSVKKYSNGYEIGFEHGGFLSIDDPGFEPRVGDPVRTYGKGYGFPVRGLDINGREAYYQTEEQYWEKFNRNREEDKRKRREALEARGATRSNSKHLLPEEVIRQFRDE